MAVVHNHPGGNPNPSKADIERARDLKVALNTLQIELIDNIVLGDGEYFSFVDEVVKIG